MIGRILPSWPAFLVVFGVGVLAPTLEYLTAIGPVL